MTVEALIERAVNQLAPLCHTAGPNTRAALREIVTDALRSPPPASEGWRTMDGYEFEIECRGMWVAGVTSESLHDAQAEISHYLTQYESEGPCEVFEIKRLRRSVSSPPQTPAERED